MLDRSHIVWNYINKYLPTLKITVEFNCFIRTRSQDTGHKTLITAHI